MITLQTMWRNHIQEHRNLFIMIAIGLVLLEIEIFALAAGKSGAETRLSISDHAGRELYTVKGGHLDPRQKEDFERTFGPLDTHRVEVVTRQRPFPLRPWLAAAVGLPVGAVLLLGFFAKAYEVLFLRGTGSVRAGEAQSGPSGRPTGILWRITRLNIFIIGGVVFVLALGIWALPQLLSELGRFGVETIGRYKWIVLGIAAVFLGLVVWIIYLRYLLARKSIESQVEVEKYRLKLEMDARSSGGVPLLEAGQDLPRLAGPSRPGPVQAQDLPHGSN